MNRAILHWILAGCVALTLTVTGSIAATPAPSTKLAVLDVGATEKVPPAFLDLLFVALGQQPQFTLLERTEIARLLREQALGMALGNQVNSAAAVKAGRLWTVDAFLMLEAGKPTDTKEIPVRVRLVDAHYGLKLWDGSIVLSQNAAKYQESIDLVAKRSVQKLEMMSRGADGLVMVAVAPLRSEEMSARWDWLKEKLTVGVEQNLGVAPGILLMERERTRSLTDERQLTVGLPDALRASAVLVDGSFKINREKGPDVVTLQLRCRRGGSTLLETKLDGSVSNSVELCRNAAKEVAAKLGVKPTDNSMEAQREAEMLAAEAQTADIESRVAFWNDKEREAAASRRAMALAEAALALVPDSCEFQRLLIATRVPDHISIDEFVADSELRLPVALRILQYCPTGKGNHNLKEVSGFMHNYLNRWEIIFRDNPQVRQHAAFNDLSQEFWNLWLAYYDKETRPWLREAAIRDAQRAGSLCATVDQAIDFSRKAVEFAAAKKPSNPTCLSFNVMDFLTDPSAQPKVIAFMDELMTATNPAVRYIGLEMGGLIYKGYPGVKPDNARVQAIAEERLALLKSQKYRSLEAWGTFGFCKYSDNEKADAEAHLHIYEDIYNYGIKENLFDFWLVKKIVGLLENAGKGKEAVAFLERYLSIPPVWDTPTKKEEAEAYLRDLRRRVPDAPVKQAAVGAAQPSDYHVTKLLALNEQAVMKSGKLRLWAVRLIMQGKIAVIVYCYRTPTENGYGVMRFDTERLQVVSDQRSDNNAKMNFPEENTQFFWNGPPVASDGPNIFIGSATDGILVFPSNGQPRLLNEENGLASQRIWTLTALDGKLYAMIGSPQSETGLMEVDWKANKSRILFSERTKSADLPLAGHGTRGILADEKRHLLWVLSGDIERGGSNWGKVSLYTYRPSENHAELKQKDILGGDDVPMRWVGEEILLWQMDSALFNPDTNERKAVNNHSINSNQAKTVPWVMPPTKSSMPPRSYTFIGGDLMVLRDRDLLWFRAGAREPVYALDLFFDKNIINNVYLRELAPTNKGLLLLSENFLYLLPEIKAPSQPVIVGR